MDVEAGAEFAEKVRAAGLRRIDQAVLAAKEQERVEAAAMHHREASRNADLALTPAAAAAAAAAQAQAAAKSALAASADRSRVLGGERRRRGPSMSSMDSGEESQISDRADVSAENLADRARKYLERRQAREAQRMRDEERKATEGLQPKPTINKRSEMLAQNRGRETDVGLALYADAELKRVSREILAEEHYEGTVLARPAITRQAAELVRDGNITDRLYQQARTKQQQQQQQQQQSQQQQQEKHAPSPNRGPPSASNRSSPGDVPSARRMSTPSQTQNSGRQGDSAGAERSRSRRASDISHTSQAAKHAESLYERALEAKQARERAIEEENKKLRMQAKPRLGAKTKQIVADLGQSSMDRLLNQDRELLSRRHARLAMSQQEDLTFKPRINAHSKRLARDQHTHDQEGRSMNESEAPSAASSTATSTTHNRLYEEYTSRQARRSTLESQAQRQRAQVEVEECTFKPHITHFDPVEEERKSNRLDVVDRLKDWQTRREQRLAQQRMQQDAQGLSEEYTFAPKINAKRSSRGRRASSNEPTASNGTSPPATTAGPDSAVDIKKKPGVDAYLERQRRAREERERKERAQQSSGTSKWTNRVTIPVGPKLGVAHRRSQTQDGSCNEVSDQVSLSSDGQLHFEAAKGRRASTASRAHHQSLTAPNAGKPPSPADLNLPRRAPPPRPPSMSPVTPAEAQIRDPEQVLQQAREQFERASKMVQAEKAQQQAKRGEELQRACNAEGQSEPAPSPTSIEARLLGFDDAAPLEQFRVLKSLLEHSS